MAYSRNFPKMAIRVWYGLVWFGMVWLVQFGMGGEGSDDQGVHEEISSMDYHG